MITHTEIICLAIKALNTDLTKWEQKCKNGSEEGRAIFNNVTKPICEKLSALKELYKIETGKVYME